METPKEWPDLRVRNVSLHRRGKPETGTLYLTTHHLIFSYYPDSKPEGGQAANKSGDHGRSASGQHSSSGSRESSSVTTTTPPSGSHNSSELSATTGSKSKTTPRKVRPKEIYVPYPLVHHCNLRPSHAQSVNRGPIHEDHSESNNEDEDLFPPTYGTSSFERPSTDSARLAPYASPLRPASPIGPSTDVTSTSSTGSGRPPAIRIKCKDFVLFALHFHPTPSEQSPDETARQVFYTLRNRCCVSNIEDMYAFHFKPPPEEVSTGSRPYDARREFARMGISPKAAIGPGSAWRISDINHDYSYSATYPSVLCVPQAVSDNMLKYGGSFRSKARVPALAYLHSNGGSITRSSQPLVGMQGKRNPQDERLVSAIFSSHTPPPLPSDDLPPQLQSMASTSTTTFGSDVADSETLGEIVPGLPQSKSETALDEDSDEKATPAHKKIYGSSRRNLIVDARPKINMLANRATGGGIEDVSNYMSGGDVPIEKVFLNIANIHVMRSSLDKVVEALGSCDYLDLPPNQDALRKSGWLGHIAGVLEGSEMVARVVGLGGSHVLVHCSDGWDRTSQVSALAQVMLDPYYRTLDGFIALVQKDFLSFGHKFRHRNGVEGSEKWFEIENERIQPSRSREAGGSESTNFQAMGSKAFSGARNWFEKNRNTLFKPQSVGGDAVSDSGSRPASPPPNSLLHTAPSSKTKDSKHKMDEKEVAPIFHQFLDAAYQLMYQTPDAFEFNERFLRRLLYQAYAGQYGEFLFNNERERTEATGKTPSVWGFFLARRHEFVNPDYVAKTDDPLLFPRRQSPEREVEVRWWNLLFGRKEEEMNVPRTLAPPEVTSLPWQISSLSFDSNTTNSNGSPQGSGTIRQAKSTPSFQVTSDGQGEASLPFNGSTTKEEPVTAEARPQQNAAQSQENSQVIPPAKSLSDQLVEPAPKVDPAPQFEQFQMEDGDPLGVSKTMAQPQGKRRLDFTAFAQQNAFSDRS